MYYLDKVNYKNHRDIFHLEFSFELKRFFDISINIFNIINGGFYIRNYTKEERSI